MLYLLFALLVIAATFGSPLEPKRKVCTTSADCLSSECCMTSREDGDLRVCHEKPGHYGLCSPFLLPGVGHSCPCLPGWTCGKPLDMKSFHCIPVPFIEDEQEWK